jgi:hypothetical protein
MSWKEFIADIISSMVWPFVVLSIIFMFKSEFVKIIQRLAHLKYKDLELDFEEVKQQAAELHKEIFEEKAEEKNPDLVSLEGQILDVVERAPSAAILLAWSGIETVMASAVMRMSISPDPPSYRSPMHCLEMLTKHGGLTSRYSNLLNDMRILRNKVTHDQNSMISTTKEQALNYAHAAKDVIQHIENLGRNT